MRTYDVIAAGVCRRSRRCPGVGARDQRRDLDQRRGRSVPATSYRVTTYSPRPTAGAAAQPRAADYPWPDADQLPHARASRPRGCRRRDFPQVTFAAFHSGPRPYVDGTEHGPDAARAAAELAVRAPRTPWPGSWRRGRARRTRSWPASSATWPRLRLQREPAGAPVSAGELPVRDQLGYCQQFSGAMALLLRMGGLPGAGGRGLHHRHARPAATTWTVTDIDAHAWVEVWFPHYGWVRFDPTPAIAPARGGSTPTPFVKNLPGDGQPARRRRAGAASAAPGARSRHAHQRRRRRPQPAAADRRSLVLAARGVLVAGALRRAPAPAADEPGGRARAGAGSRPAGRSPKSVDAGRARAPLPFLAGRRRLRPGAAPGPLRGAAAEPPTASSGERCASSCASGWAVGPAARTVGAAAPPGRPGAARGDGRRREDRRVTPRRLNSSRWTTSTTCSAAAPSCWRPATTTRRRSRSRAPRDLAPEQTSIREALGRALFHSQRTSRRRAEFQAVIDRAPTNDFALFCLGRSPADARPPRRGAPAAGAGRLPAAGPARLPRLSRSRARARAADG